MMYKYKDIIYKTKDIREYMRIFYYFQNYYF